LCPLQPHEIEKPIGKKAMTDQSSLAINADAGKGGFISEVIGPKKQIVGDDPVEFVEAFAQNYTKGGYVPDRERNRLTSAIARAAGDDTGNAKRAA
jgi:hypothetical protein